ncbi:MAG: alpha/beta fold hydrolase [Anaerolineaceae bacterium]
MTNQHPSAGYLKCGMAFNRLGRGPKPLIVFQGLMFENKPQPAVMVNMYRFLGNEYTVYVVLRRPGLPKGTTLKDMADDYAAMMREEFGEGPFDVVGVSTGGSIVQIFAADHPELVRRLVIHSSAYTLTEQARSLQMQIARLAGEGCWKEANRIMMAEILPRGEIWKVLKKPLLWLTPMIMGPHPRDANDLVVTVEAEDVFNFKERLSEIKAPTLVAAGENDPFYSPALFRETAKGIPDARLILYKGMGHPAGGKLFASDVMEFLKV